MGNAQEGVINNKEVVAMESSKNDLIEKFKNVIHEISSKSKISIEYICDKYSINKKTLRAIIEYINENDYDVFVLYRDDYLLILEKSNVVNKCCEVSLKNKNVKFQL